ncbi:MAG: pentapeptide repeat-containing protein [Gemmatimonadota bacterium]
MRSALWLVVPVMLTAVVPARGQDMPVMPPKTAGPVSAPVTGAMGPLTVEQVKAKLAAGAEPDLSGADLTGLDFTGVDFRSARMVGVRLDKAVLSGANLFSCDMTGASLVEATLRKTNLDGVTLRKADLRRADLTGASLYATIDEDADFSGANMTGTRIIGYLKHAKLVGTILHNADIGVDPSNQSMGLMRATFTSADLTGADLTGANMYKVDLSYAILVKARLAHARLESAELVGADFTGADLTESQLGGADLAQAVFTGATGVRTIKGLDQTRNRDKAQFDEHME